VPTKELLVVAGPNGAGKSTFVAKYLSAHPRPYLCADLIATEFPNLDPISQQIAAGREFLLRMEGQLAKDESFVVETTLSGRTMRSFLARARAAGFEITIVFIYLDTAELCVQRVNQRVLHGGHSVPVDDIRRRFARSFANFWQIYRQIADYWYVVYNSSGDFKRVASGELDTVLVRDELAFTNSCAWPGRRVMLKAKTTISDEALRKGEEIERIGQSAVREAQEENRRRGIPNVYSINGVLYWELPDGTLSRTDPYNDPATAKPTASS
jgi:predicted ABC-type ATPase